MSEWKVSSSDGAVIANNGRFQMRAEHIRQSYTGPHASVTIAIDGHDLGDDLFNLLRGEYRTKLAKKCWGKLGPEEKAEYDFEFMDVALAAFCKRVWPEFNRVSGVVGAGCETEPSPIEFMLKPYVMKGGGTIIFAPPGAGKSYITYLIAVSIDAGCGVLWPVTQRKVLVINIERSLESVNRRIWRVNSALGLPLYRRLPVLQARGKSLQSIMEQAQAAIKANGYELVLLDSISRSGFGDLNENMTANAVIDNLNALCETWFAIGHTPRGDSSHIFGSVHFEAGQDIGIAMNSRLGTSARTLGMSLEITKANDMPKPPVEVLALEFDEGGLTAVRRSSLKEFPSLASGKPQDVADQVFDLLRDAGAMSATDIANELGCNRQNVSALLNADQRFVRVRKEGKSVLYGVATCE